MRTRAYVCGAPLVTFLSQGSGKASMLSSSWMLYFSMTQSPSCCSPRFTLHLPFSLAEHALEEIVYFFN